MHRENISVKKINIVVSIIFILILGMNVALQVRMNKKNAIMACEVALDQAEAIVEKKMAPQNMDIAGVRLLMAEDNELNAEIAQFQLEGAGASVIVARDGKQALELFAESPQGTFDAILMDIMMLVMDGITAIRYIRVLDRADAMTIPIIAMSANAFEEDAKAGIEAGMNAHLAKPLKIERVIATIAEYCKRNEVSHEENEYDEETARII